MRRGAALLALVVLLVRPSVAGAESGTVRRERLPNGMRVIVRENTVAPVVAAELMVEMGSRWERPDDAGMSNFVHAVMVKGTTKLSGAELAEKIASIGGKLSATGDVDYSEIRGQALARFWRELLDLTAQLALEPRLAATDVNEERTFLLSRVERRRDNPFGHAFDELYRVLYGPHPYSLSPIGTAASLERIDHQAIVAEYRTFYRPDRMVLAVSGAVKADEVLAEARRLFGGMRSAGPSPNTRIPPPPPPAARRVVIEQPTQQTQILVGALAPSLSDPDHAAVKVLATVLGGGMAGRLFSDLRDKQGLAYNARAYYDPTRDPGALVLYVGTAPANTERAEQALFAEIARIRTQLVGEAELRRAKGYLLGRYLMDRRTNERVAWYLAFYDTEHVPPDYPERYRQAVGKVSAQDVLRVARRYLATVATVVLKAPRAR